MTGPFPLHTAKANRRALRILGFNISKLSDAEIAEGGELVRLITACCGVGPCRRGKAVHDWHIWAAKHQGARKG
jgi:hypothetical protein